MDLFLNAGENHLLTGILEHRLEELRREINHTDSRAFKAGLKADEVLLQGIIEKIKTPVPMGM